MPQFITPTGKCYAYSHNNLLYIYALRSFFRSWYECVVDVDDPLLLDYFKEIEKFTIDEIPSHGLLHICRWKSL